MTIHSSTDHGYNRSATIQTVRVGDTFRKRNALGIAEYRVLRPHRDAGYFEVIFDRWIGEDLGFCQGFIGQLEVMSRAYVLNAKYTS